MSSLTRAANWRELICIPCALDLWAEVDGRAGPSGWALKDNRWMPSCPVSCWICFSLTVLGKRVRMQGLLWRPAVSILKAPTVPIPTSQHHPHDIISMLALFLVRWTEARIAATPVIDEKCRTLRG